MTGEKLTLTLESYSSQYSASYPATNAFDGSTSTYWRTSNSATIGAYLITKVDSLICLTGFRLYPSTSSYRPKSFVLAISNNGVDFIDVYSGECSSTSAWIEYEIDSNLIGKYIKVTFNGYSTSRLDVYDFEVYGNTKKFRSHGIADFNVDPLSNITSVFNSKINWYQETPEGTSCSVSAKIGDGEFLTCINGDGLPGLNVGDDIHDKIITIRVDLSTSDTSETPVFGAMSLIIADQSDGNIIVLKFAKGCKNSIQNAVGDVVITYSGGTLTGIGGPVNPFEIIFIPTDLASKNNPNDEEHIVSNVTLNGNLIRIYYTDVQDSEHISVGVSTIGTLIHVDDI